MIQGLAGKFKGASCLLYPQCQVPPGEARSAPQIELLGQLSMATKRADTAGAPTQAKRVRLSFGQQLALVKEVEDARTAHRDLPRRVLAEKYGISRAAVTLIVSRITSKTEDEREQLGVNKDSKSDRGARFPVVDQAVFKVFCEARASNLPVSGPMLQQLAKDFAAAAGIQGFVASPGYLENLKHRYGIKARRISGEAGAVPMDVVGLARPELQQLIAGYAPDGA